MEEEEEGRLFGEQVLLDRSTEIKSALEVRVKGLAGFAVYP